MRKGNLSRDLEEADGNGSLSGEKVSRQVFAKVAELLLNALSLSFDSVVMSVRISENPSGPVWESLGAIGI